MSRPAARINSVGPRYALERGIIETLDAVGAEVRQGTPEASQARRQKAEELAELLAYIQHRARIDAQAEEAKLAERRAARREAKRAATG